MVLLLAGVLKTMQVRKERMDELAAEGYCTATELADTLVRECQFPFRTAHEVVGLVVKKAVDTGLDPRQISHELVVQCIREHVGKDVALRPESVRKALDPRENVRIRNLPGGPAFEETTRMMANRKQIVMKQREFLLRCQSQIAGANEKREQSMGQILQKGRK
ncbi:MAG: argininosuccinate lyase, partial [Deltaproteobacteria bacterium]|nr:argininosuccinate lyase [Deltaproteobacteria bacterium]